MHDRILALLACSLCVSTLFKIGQIQLLELLYAVDSVLICGWLVLQASPVPIFRPFLRISVHWFLFSIFSMLLALIALRNPFYAENISILKEPFIATLSRIVELYLDVFMMVYLASRCREDISLCRFTALAYFWIGITGCIYGILSEIAMLGGIVLGGATTSFRMAGFDNEAGPFGVYMVTVLVAALALWQMGWIRPRMFYLSVPLFVVCLMASQSKSALLEIIVFVIVIAFLRMKPVHAISAALAIVLVGGTVFQALGLTELSLRYFDLAQYYREASLLRPDDLNFVAGRVAGIYLAPKMIAEHPLAGIGLGNYTIVRDDPQYRRGSAIVSLPLDAPSLGFLDYIVELGFPLFFYLTWVQIAPAVAILRHGARSGMIALVLCVPISVWFGAHLNLTYPWIAAALGLAMFYGGERRPAPSQSKDLLLQTGTMPTPLGR